MFKIGMVQKSEVLELLNECKKEISDEAKEAKSKYSNEVSVSNRSYYQGVYVGATNAANKLQKLINQVEAY